MIDDGGGGSVEATAVELALAERMISEEAKALTTPLRIVATRMGRASLVVTGRTLDHRDALVRSTVAPLNELGASGIGARSLRSNRHAWRILETQKAPSAWGWIPTAKAPA